jgi:hypothetical protein
MTLPTIEQLEAMLAGSTPDWSVYGEPDVGLPSSLFAGTVGTSGFGPIEPLQGFDLMLAALAPTLATQRIADAKRISELEAALRASRRVHCDIAEHCLQAKSDGHPISRTGIFADSQRARIAAEKSLGSSL